jgi:hypothetical protein
MDTGRVRRLVVVLPVLAVLPLALTACGGDDPSGPGQASGPEPSPSSSLYTLTPLPMPEKPPPTGTLVADMRQSSRDAAANRFEVWIYNDTVEAIRPTKVTYSDGRFRTTLPGTRLREIPSQSERGFPIYQPDQPACDSTAKHGEITVEYGGTTVTVPVEDETDVVGRYTSARCLETAVAEVAELSWDDAVPADEEGVVGTNGTLTLVVRTTGVPGHTLTIDTVSGTPVLAPVGTDVWRPDATIHGDDPPSRIPLPLKPNRCDAHAFAESGGATAFKIGLHLDGEPGQITLRMSTAGAANAINFAQATCGFLVDINGNVASGAPVPSPSPSP